MPCPLLRDSTCAVGQQSHSCTETICCPRYPATHGNNHWLQHVSVAQSRHCILQSVSATPAYIGPKVCRLGLHNARHVPHSAQHHQCMPCMQHMCLRPQKTEWVVPAAGVVSQDALASAAAHCQVPCHPIHGRIHRLLRSVL
ncbi:hypothetical protein ORF051R [Spotted knifejaw iridovirus]|nr:hypothetical protein ORF051R [Spotted knifejaw iridovirus]